MRSCPAVAWPADTLQQQTDIEEQRGSHLRDLPKVVRRRPSEPAGAFAVRRDRQPALQRVALGYKDEAVAQKRLIWKSLSSGARAGSAAEVRKQRRSSP